VQELAERLPHEQAYAETVALSLKRTQNRISAKAKIASSEGRAGRPATAQQIGELARDLTREIQLKQESYRVQAQIQASSEALEQAQSHLQQLERALALAMAQARTLARKQAQARSPRLRALALGRFLWRLMQARQGLWDGIVRSLYLGMRVVRLAVWMLPTADRDRWKNESFTELEELKEEGAPLLGDAVRIALRTPSLALVLRAAAWRRSPAARWLPRLKPVWIGLGTAAATFLGGAAGIGQSPTEFQMRALVGASLLTGALAVTGSYRGRRPRRRRRKRR